MLPALLNYGELSCRTGYHIICLVQVVPQHMTGKEGVLMWNTVKLFFLQQRDVSQIWFCHRCSLKHFHTWRLPHIWHNSNSMKRTASLLMNSISEEPVSWRAGPLVWNYLQFSKLEWVAAMQSAGWAARERWQRPEHTWELGNIWQKNLLYNIALLWLGKHICAKVAHC